MLGTCSVFSFRGHWNISAGICGKWSRDWACESPSHRSYIVWDFTFVGQESNCRRALRFLEEKSPISCLARCNRKVSWLGRWLPTLLNFHKINAFSTAMLTRSGLSNWRLAGRIPPASPYNPVRDYRPENTVHHQCFAVISIYCLQSIY